MTRMPYRTVIDAPERAEIRETIAGLRREVRKLRRAERTLGKVRRKIDVLLAEGWSGDAYEGLRVLKRALGPSTLRSKR